MLFRSLRTNNPSTKPSSKRPRGAKFETLGQRLVLSGNSVSSGEACDHMIEQQGSVVFIFGSDTDDFIRVEMGTAEHTIRVNGEVQTFDASIVDEIVVAGQEGNDEVNIFGSSLDDRIEIQGNELELTSEEYTVRVREAEVVRAAGVEGNDTARIVDTEGDDELYMHPTFSTFVNSDGQVFKVSGVDRVEAFARHGGRDIVRFYDSPEDDTFVAKASRSGEDRGFAYMIGSDFWNYADNFERVDAVSQNGGQDSARLYDSAGDDVLVARPNLVVLEATTALLVTRDFFTTRTIATLGGNDTAELHGQALVEDKFVWQDNSSYMFTTGRQDPDSLNLDVFVEPITASNLAIGFDHIEACGSDNSDRAELRGSAGDDQVIALPEVVQMTTQNADVEAWDFRIVRSLGRGGNDRAQLQDSDANETYVSNSRFAYLEGPDYLNYVSGFSIDVFATKAGDDFAHAQDYTGPNQDYLIFDGNQFLIWGPNRQERIHDFNDARGDGDGPAGFQLLDQITHAFTLGGAHDQTDLPDEDTANAIVERSDELITLYEIVDGEIVEVA